MEAKKRIFVAIDLPQKIKNKLGRLLKPFNALPIRILGFKNWHVTLAFLGYLHGKEIDQLEEILKNCLRNKASFNMSIKDISWGPPGRRPRMLWGNLETTSNYQNIVTCIEEKLLNIQKEHNFFGQFKPLRRPLKVHITLARFREEEWPEIEKMANKINLELPDYTSEFKVEKIHIMQSNLSRAGAEYEIIKTYTLQQ